LASAGELRDTDGAVTHVMALDSRSHAAKLNVLKHLHVHKFVQLIKVETQKKKDLSRTLLS
jgi:hypothetical protein